LEVLTALEKGGYNLPARIIELKNHQGKSLKTS
jgi:small conductance mechanosensitive channel